MKRIKKTIQPENLTFILRNQFQLTDEQLLSIQICAFTSIKEVIIERSSEGKVYDAHLLFSNFDSEIAKELRYDMTTRCEDKLLKEVQISPLLISRMASETVSEVIQFISKHFKKNSFESILAYFKINEMSVNGLMLFH